MFVGAFAFAFAIYSFMSATPKAAAPKHPKLKLAPSSSPHVAQADNTDLTNYMNIDGTQFTGADGSIDIHTLMSAASMLIWGLVLAKARSGLEAVETKDT